MSRSAEPKHKYLSPGFSWSDQEQPPEFIRSRNGKTSRRTRRRTSGKKHRSRLRGLYAIFILIVLAIAAARYIPSFFSSPVGTVRFLDSLSHELRLPIPNAELKGILYHKIKRGDTLATIASGYGLDSTVATRIYAALLDLKKEKGINTTLRVGQDVEFILSEKSDVFGLTLEVSQGKKVVVAADEKGDFVVRIQQLPKEPRERVAVGVVESSFAAAAQAAGVSYDIVDELVDLLSDRVVFHKDFRKGDRFTLIYRDRVLEDGTVLQSGPIMAAILDIDGERFAAVRYVGTDGKARYFNESGELVGNSFLRYPLKFSRISSYYTDSRLHPVLKRRRPHHGVDFAAPIGTPVRSVADGRVTFAGRKGANGIMIKIRHNQRYATAYLHLSKLASGIRYNVAVKRGQLIGYVGTTGLSTGPHLDYRFSDSGKYINPLTVKLPILDTLKAGTKIDEKYLRRALYTLNHYQTVDLGGMES